MGLWMLSNILALIHLSFWSALDWGRLTIRLAEDAQIELGEQCGISFQTERIHFFDQEEKSLSKN